MMRAVVFFAVLAIAAAAFAGIEGTWEVAGTNAEGYTYEGTCEVSRNGDVYNVQWWIGEGVHYGVGFMMDEVFCVGWSDGGGFFGVALYTLKGNQANGVWASYGDSEAKIEVWTR
jgi:hypothetical protein